MFLSNRILETIRLFIQDQLSNDPFAGTPFAGYVYLSLGNKGNVGEISALGRHDEAGIPVSGPTSPGQDLHVNGLPTEVKISLGIKKNTVNHLSVGKPWEESHLIIGNPHKEIGLYVLKKPDFIRALDETDLFNTQQGGKKVGNDDYMISANKLRTFLNSPYVSRLDTWKPN
jgi:hypothetical protein